MNPDPHSKTPDPIQPISAEHDHDPNGAFIVCLDPQQRILSGRKTYGAKLRSLPGGGIHPNEDADMAALRETQEETGFFLLAVNLRLIGIMSQRLPNHPTKTGLVTVFEADVTDRTRRPTDGELVDLEWLTIWEAIGRRQEFEPPQLRVMYLAHLRRNTTGGRNFFAGHMTKPIEAVLPDGSVVTI